MASQKREDPKRPAEKKTTGKEELSSRELDKVTGGLKRAKTGDPCDGGE